MTIQIQPASGPIADATEEQLAAIRAGLDVPSSGQMTAGLEGKADASHEHSVAEVAGLMATLAAMKPAVVLVSASRSLGPSDDGQVLEVTASGVTLTVPTTGLAADFACAVNPLTGTVSVASAGVATLNGDTAILTRASASNPMFAIVRRASVANGYTVTGG